MVPTNGDAGEDQPPDRKTPLPVHSHRVLSDVVWAASADNKQIIINVNRFTAVQM